MFRRVSLQGPPVCRGPGRLENVRSPFRRLTVAHVDARNCHLEYCRQPIGEVSTRDAGRDAYRHERDVCALAGGVQVPARRSTPWSNASARDPGSHVRSIPANAGRTRCSAETSHRYRMRRCSRARSRSNRSSST